MKGFAFSDCFYYQMSQGCQGQDICYYASGEFNSYSINFTVAITIIIITLLVNYGELLVDLCFIVVITIITAIRDIAIIIG